MNQQCEKLHGAGLRLVGHREGGLRDPHRVWEENRS